MMFRCRTSLRKEKAQQYIGLDMAAERTAKEKFPEYDRSSMGERGARKLIV